MSEPPFWNAIVHQGGDLRKYYPLADDVRD